MTSIANIIRQAIVDGKDDAAILAAVKAEHPDAKTGANSLGFYRSEVKEALRKTNRLSDVAAATIQHDGAIGRLVKDQIVYIEDGVVRTSRALPTEATLFAIRVLVPGALVLSDLPKAEAIAKARATLAH